MILRDEKKLIRRLKEVKEFYDEEKFEDYNDKDLIDEFANFLEENANNFYTSYEDDFPTNYYNYNGVLYSVQVDDENYVINGTLADREKDEVIDRMKQHIHSVEVEINKLEKL
jgi:hypothetical protein